MGLFGKKKEANKADQDILMGNLEIEDDASYDIGGTVEAEVNLEEDIADDGDFDTTENDNDASNLFDIPGIDFGTEDNNSNETFDVPDIAGDDIVETPDDETISTKNMMYSDDDRQNEVIDFLSNFSDGNQGEVILNASDLENIREDIVLDGGEEKSYKGVIIASIIGLVGAIVAFFLAFIASQYNMVMDPVLNAHFVYDGKISLADKHPVVQSHDLYEGVEILYKKDSASRFVDQYNKGLVKKIKERTVRVYNEQTAKEEDIPYEQIWYIVDKNANGAVEFEIDEPTEPVQSTESGATEEQVVESASPSGE